MSQVTQQVINLIKIVLTLNKFFKEWVQLASDQNNNPKYQTYCQDVSQIVLLITMKVKHHRPYKDNKRRKKRTKKGKYRA